MSHAARAAGALGNSRSSSRRRAPIALPSRPVSRSAAVVSAVAQARGFSPVTFGAGEAQPMPRWPPAPCSRTKNSSTSRIVSRAIV